MTPRRGSAVLAAACTLTLLASTASAQIRELPLPDLSSPEALERAAISARAKLSAAVARARSGEVIFVRGPEGLPFIPVERRALRTYVAIQVQAGKLAPADAQAFEQRLLADQPAVLADAEATLARLPSAPSTQRGSPVTGAALCDVLRVAPGDTVQMLGGDCALMLGTLGRPEQAFTVGQPRDGRDACVTIREAFAQAKGGVREVPGLGEFGFAGVSDTKQFGVAFCRNGVAVVGVADSNVPATVHDAMIARARAVDERLRGLGARAPETAASSTCDPPNVGPLADGVAAALTLRSGQCIAGVLLDMGGADYTMQVGSTERRIALGDVALIDFTAGGSTGGAPPAGQHELTLRTGQLSVGRLFDLSGRSPLIVTFDTAEGRRSLPSTEVDRIVLFPRGDTTRTATAGGATPATTGGGAAPTGAVCASLPGDWRRNDGLVIRIVRAGSGFQGSIVNVGAATIFSLGEQTLLVEGSPQPGICTGQAKFKFADGRAEWRPTRIAMVGTDSFETDNAGIWIRTRDAVSEPAAPQPARRF